MTTAPIQRKHVDESDIFGSDFADQLAVGESLIGTPDVKVVRMIDGSDKTTDFLDPASVAINGTRIEFLLVARVDSSKQPVGNYVVFVKCDTNVTGIELVDTWTLVSHDEGSTD